jgi:hypothetical protein
VNAPVRYRKLQVLEHRDGDLLVRICFERLTDGFFAVPVTEYLREDMDISRRQREMEENILELLIDPETPDSWDFFETLEQAINNHDREFAEMKLEIDLAKN